MAVAYGTYAFLHARLGALKAELLSADQWDKLLAAESFADVLHELESTAYAGWLSRTPEETLASLRNVVYRLARIIERSAPPAAGRFIHLWARRDLLRNLKALGKGKALGLPEEEIRADLIELDPLYPLPVDALMQAGSLDAALDLLEATPLRGWIREARHIYSKDPSLFGLDAALDRLQAAAGAGECSRAIGAQTARAGAKDVRAFAPLGRASRPGVRATGGSVSVVRDDKPPQHSHRTPANHRRHAAYALGQDPAAAGRRRAHGGGHSRGRPATAAVWTSGQRGRAGPHDRETPRCRGGTVATGRPCRQLTLAGPGTEQDEPPGPDAPRSTDPLVRRQHPHSAAWTSKEK